MPRDSGCGAWSRGHQELQPPDCAPPQAYGLWDHEEDTFPKKKAEAEQVEDEEEEERREEAVSPPRAVGEEGTEALAEAGAPGAAAGPELEGDAVGQEEGAGTMQLRFRRKRHWGKKQPEAAPEEGECWFPALMPQRGARLVSPRVVGCLGRAGCGLQDPGCHPCCASLTGDAEEEEEEEVEEEAKQSHAQKKLKAFGLRVKLFFLTM